MANQTPASHEKPSMPGFTDTLKTINSFIRTMLATVVVGGSGWFGYNAYSTYNAKDIEIQKQEALLQEAKSQIQQQGTLIASLNSDLEKKAAEIERLETAIHLLKVDHRLARLTVLDQAEDPTTKALTTVVEFVELNDEGEPIDRPRKFSFKGSVIYVDNWIVKFDDKYVETAEIGRSTSLVLFRRIFGEHQEPANGYLLEETQGPPKAYARGSKASDFEQKIWGDFWNIANDEAKARELGIRAAHGEAVSIKTQKGKSYKLLLRASDGLSIVPESTPAAVKPAA